MAYAALSSLMHTLQQLLLPNQRLVFGSSIQQHAEPVYQSVCAIQIFLENSTQEIYDIENLKVLEKRITDVVYEAEDRVDSSLRSIILANNAHDRETACKIFNNELQQVEKEVDSLMKEVIQSKCAELATTSSSSRKYATGQNTVVGMEDDFNTITDSFTAQTNKLTVMPVVGMKDDFNIILDRLTAQTKELTVISIVGMGGIGKSTLARKVYDDSSIRYRFDIHAWITVSETYNERLVLLDVVSSIRRINRADESIKNICSDQLMDIVYKGLKGRRFLIVIDDIWSTEAWDQMHRMFPNDDNNSRILLTTRIKKVADYASCPDFPPHDVSFLSFDDSWILFTERLFLKNLFPPQLEEIGKHIVQRCQGLPLSIVVVAGLLSKIDLTYDNWKKVEENLNSFFGTASEQCLTILSLSYSYLPQHLKACFLYVGCFPEDMEIGVSKLINLWIAEQFIKAKSNKRLEVVAEEYLQELIDRSLILAGRRRANGRMKTCKIHDLLRQLCIREAQTENLLHIMNYDDLSNSECINYERRVIIPINDIEYVYRPRIMSDISNAARSLVFTGYAYEDYAVWYCSSIVSRFELLKVLDVSTINYNFSWVIPKLVHLRYVAAYIDKAPSLAKLRDLQTIILFSFEGAQLELPLEIWIMSKIRYLDTGRNIHLPNPLAAESHIEEQKPLFLNNLQSLTLHSSPFVSEILRGTPNLNKLKITEVSNTEWSGFLDCLVLLPRLETLHIKSIGCNATLSRDIFLPNLKKLKLAWTDFPWKDMIVLANLPNLEVFKATFAFDGTDWRLNEDVMFQKLKYLHIQFGDLERWEATSDNFPMLEQLILIGLHELEEIPQSIGEITTLKLIHIEDCSSAAIASAKQIQEEQESWGNYDLKVRIIKS